MQIEFERDALELVLKLLQAHEVEDFGDTSYIYKCAVWAKSCRDVSLALEELDKIAKEAALALEAEHENRTNPRP